MNEEIVLEYVLMNPFLAEIIKKPNSALKSKINWLDSFHLWLNKSLLAQEGNKRFIGEQWLVRRIWAIFSLKH